MQFKLVHCQCKNMSLSVKASTICLTSLYCQLTVWGLHQNCVMFFFIITIHNEYIKMEKEALC